MRTFSRNRGARFSAVLLVILLHGCSQPPALVAEPQEIDRAVAQAESQLKAAKSEVAVTSAERPTS